jgi:hypothetical protein
MQRLRQGREVEYRLYAGQIKRIVRIIYSLYIRAGRLILWSREQLLGLEVSAYIFSKGRGKKGDI